MKFITFIASLGFATCAVAAPDQIRSNSPAGKFTAVFKRNSDTEDYRLSLIAPDGKVRFQSDPIDLTIPKKSIIWNSTGDALAFSAGTHFLMTAFILISQDGDYSLKRVPSPKGDWDNFHQTPEKWSKGLLTVRIDGPHAGKATDYHYEGQMTIDISNKLKVISENINAVEQGAAANP